MAPIVADRDNVRPGTDRRAIALAEAPLLSSFNACARGCRPTLTMKPLDREVRISVNGLVLGMYVSRLDRPWLETSFPMEGLRVSTTEILRQLRQICAHVYIDTSLGPSPDLRFLDLDERSVVQQAQAREEIERLRTRTWEVRNTLAEELVVAEPVYEGLESGIEEVMGDLSTGRKVDLPKLKDGIDAMVDSILRNPSAVTWLREMKRKDNYSYQHALGCAIWAASFGRYLGLERADLQKLALGGLLCDVGKIQLSRELLEHTGPLTEDHRKDIHRHVEHSLALVEDIPGLPQGIIEMIATHHERHDGSGYPRSLKGSEIPMFGRIMGLVDSYNAITSTRPYAAGRSPHEAVEELYRNRGVLFQPELVEQFIQSCGIYPTGSLVELSNGQVGVVTQVHALKRLRPRVMLLLDHDKTALDSFHELDLSALQEGAPDEPEEDSLTVKCGLPAGAYGIQPSELFLD